MLFYEVVFWISVLPAGSAPPLLPPAAGNYDCWGERREHRYIWHFPVVIAGDPTQMCLLARAAFSLPVAAGEFTLL